MRITESQLRKVIRDVIKENDKTLNEGFLSHRILPALLIMSGLSHVGNAINKVNMAGAEQAIERTFKNTDPKVIVDAMEAEGIPLSTVGVREYAKGQGIVIHNDALFDKMVDEYLLKELNPFASENPTSYDGPAGPMSMPESRTRRRRRS